MADDSGKKLMELFMNTMAASAANLISGTKFKESINVTSTSADISINIVRKYYSTSCRKETMAPAVLFYNRFSVKYNLLHSIICGQNTLQYYLGYAKRNAANGMFTIYDENGGGYVKRCKVSLSELIEDLSRGRWMLLDLLEKYDTQISAILADHYPGVDIGLPRADNIRVTVSWNEPYRGFRECYLEDTA